MTPPFRLPGVGRAAMAVVVLACLACRTDGPQPIDTAADACSRCRMSIDRLDHAGEVITADGRVRKYDSLGCLVLDLDRMTTAGERPRGVWVVEYRSHTWMRAEEAFYALASLTTDHMGYGVAAAATRQGALQLTAGDAGRSVAWHDLLPRIKAMEQRRHE